jgi:hypothetical protein
MLANVALIALMGIAGRQLIDNNAHLGGFAAGVGIGFIAYFTPATRRRAMTAVAFGSAAGLSMIGAFVLAVARLSQAAQIESAVAALPPLVQQQPKIWDATARFSALFKIDAKFSVISGEVDATRAENGGPIIDTLRGTLLSPGLYVFEFNEVDRSGTVYQIRNVRVEVLPNVNVGQALISPEDEVWERYNAGTLIAGPQAVALVKWTDRPAEIVGGHWRLKSVAFAQN